MEISFNAEIGGKSLKIQAGKIAKQASGSVLVQYADTIVLVAVVSAQEPKVDAGFLPMAAAARGHAARRFVC